MSSYKDLIVWRKGIQTVKEVYQATAHFPVSEQYGLTSQLRRAAVSIPSNIAEGNGRSSRRDYLHFLDIARGSCYELETQLIICKELKLLTLEEYHTLYVQNAELGRMLNALIQNLSNGNLKDTFPGN